MLRFECDYGEGAHPKILERLLEAAVQQHSTMIGR